MFVPNLQERSGGCNDIAELVADLANSADEVAAIASLLTLVVLGSDIHGTRESPEERECATHRSAGQRSSERISSLDEARPNECGDQDYASDNE